MRTQTIPQGQPLIRRLFYSAVLRLRAGPFPAATDFTLFDLNTRHPLSRAYWTPARSPIVFYHIV